MDFAAVYTKLRRKKKEYERMRQKKILTQLLLIYRIQNKFQLAEAMTQSYTRDQ
jgi:hypothetical protein